MDANGVLSSIYDSDNRALRVSSGAYTDEMARDAIGAALTAGTGITVTPNDGADTITIAATGSAANLATIYAFGG